jgi:hypothetical protein
MGVSYESLTSLSSVLCSPGQISPLPWVLESSNLKARRISVNHLVESTRSLWELDMSTAMSNNPQAGIAQPPAAEGGESKMQHSCLRARSFTPRPSDRTRTSTAESSDRRSPLFPITTINSLEVVGAGVCLHPGTQPTWAQLSACLSFVLLSLLSSQLGS